MQVAEGLITIAGLRGCKCIVHAEVTVTSLMQACAAVRQVVQDIVH